MTLFLPCMKKRFREYGLTVGRLPTGPKNLISDISGVRVGHVSYVEGDDIRTGLTVIDPGLAGLFRKKLPAGLFVGNGYGKMAGVTQVEELGTIETPIALTNTLAVGPVMRGIIDYVIEQTPDIQPFESINAVVGEANDAWLSRIHKDVVKKEDVKRALETAQADFALGCVGAGTGTRAFAWKGGIGSSSRTVVIDEKKYTIGALVQTNYGGALKILGKDIGYKLGKTDFDTFLPADGSCMIVVATDAPVSSRTLKRLAKRATLALVRTGSVMAHGSGDYAIVFSTSRAGLDGPESTSLIREDNLTLTSLFLATMDAVEESIYDALFLAETTKGRDGELREALPVDQILSWLTE